ncbi:MAG TPA: indole-3-glycerol phosphate synthase TrpC [Thermoanaerobaculia bacterium]|nr:indole-3-glycerol phosphate synthase TrpC [Thermoanaerobaculia bacterium]
MTILDRIVERTRARLAAGPLDRKDLRREAMVVAQQRQPHAFAAALRGAQVSSPALIAEIKSASPSAGSIVDNPDVESIARDYRDGGAAAISVVTEPEFFRGDVQWLHRAAGASALPVIMKDFVVDPAQILAGVAGGAQAMLLLASLLMTAEMRRFIETLDSYGCDALVEVHDEEELQRALDAGARIVGVNNRDLRDFSVDLATSERLAVAMPREIIRVAESGIRTHADVMRLRAAGFDAVLVGESLLRQNDRSAAVRRLIEGDDR